MEFTVIIIIRILMMMTSTTKLVTEIGHVS